MVFLGVIRPLHTELVDPMSSNLRRAAKVSLRVCGRKLRRSSNARVQIIGTKMTPNSLRTLGTYLFSLRQFGMILKKKDSKLAEHYLYELLVAKIDGMTGLGGRR